MNRRNFKMAKETKSRKANPAFMKALNISPALAKVVGDKPLPRTEVVKKCGSISRSMTFRTPPVRGISRQTRI